MKQNVIETTDKSCKIMVGDALKILADFPDKTFQCCVTSPPYWGLRDYGIKGQIGAETDVKDYITHLVQIFGEIKPQERKFSLKSNFNQENHNMTTKVSKYLYITYTILYYRANKPERVRPKEMRGVEKK